MSSMRSASSSTRYSTPSSFAYGCLKWSSRRPGVATMHVDAAAEGVLLRTHADAAEDRGAGQRRVHGERVQVLEDLRRQLARRGQDERPGHAPRLLDEPVQDGQQERGGLAAPGHGAREHVPALHGGGNGVSLDGGGTGEPEFPDTFLEVRVELERCEGHTASYQWLVAAARSNGRSHQRREGSAAQSDRQLRCRNCARPSWSCRRNCALPALNSRFTALCRGYVSCSTDDVESGAEPGNEGANVDHRRATRFSRSEDGSNGGLRTLIVELRQDMHSRFDQVDKRSRSARRPRGSP